MILKVENIAKIKDAKLEIEGFTVIAGENDTGKSTFGKILYCLFNAFYNSSEAILEERVNSVRQSIMRIVPRKVLAASNLYRKNVDKISRGIVESVFDVDIDCIEKDDISEIIIDYFRVYYVDFPAGIDESALDKLMEQIKNALCLYDSDVHRGIISRYFSDEFNRQINHINRPTSVGRASLQIKGKINSVKIKSNECVGLSHDVNIINQAIYIDSPFVMDNPDEYFYDSYAHRDFLRQKLETAENSSVIDETINKKKLQNVMENLNRLAEGEFVYDSGGVKYKLHGFTKPVNISNLSTGLKSFLIIKRLIENNIISDNGLLILDEPEVHLHPEWQIKYAELLVLLQCEFNMNIVLNTHSPYFLRAVEVFSRRYEIDAKCRYYSAEADGVFASITDVGNETNILYEKLARPFQMLEDILFN